MTFDYYRVSQSYGNLEVDNPNNCFIEAYADNGNRFCLAVKTVDGFTSVLEQGPINMITLSATTKYATYVADAKKNTKLITTFLNNPTYKITQAIATDDIDFDKFVNLVDMMK